MTNLEMKFMKIALHSNQVTNSTLAIITKILELAATYKIEIVASSKLVALLRDKKKIPHIQPFSSEHLATSLKLVISIGGDDLVKSDIISNLQNGLI